MLENRIERIENDGWVIVNFVLADGSKVDITIANEDDDKATVAFEVISDRTYEENGYDCDGVAIEAVIDIEGNMFR